MPDGRKTAEFLGETARADGYLSVKAMMIAPVWKWDGVDFLAEFSCCAKGDVFECWHMGAVFRAVECGRRDAFRAFPYSLYQPFHEDLESIAESLKFRT